jgi:hypothetical protein
MKLWYTSFCGDDEHGVERFLGGVYLWAETSADVKAGLRATVLREHSPLCGAEGLTCQVPPRFVKNVPARAIGRLLSKDELRAITPDLERVDSNGKKIGDA